MSRRLFIAGVGPGGREYILPAVEKAIEQSNVLIGGRRNLELFDHVQKEKVAIGNNLEEILEFIEKHIKEKTITVLASGDPGVFGILEFLKNRLQDVEICVIPGISSFQYLCAKIKTSWHDIRILSLHGREQKELCQIVHSNAKVAIFTGGTSSPQGICRELAESGLTGVSVTVGENLSYSNERIVTATPEGIARMHFDTLSIMLVQNENVNINSDKASREWRYTTAGIPDSMFIRGEVPMTKEEVRTVTLAKLRLGEGDTVYDIGAGTGSVSVECGLRCSKGRIYAIEKEKDAVELIGKNIKKFGLDNVQIVEGEAPEVLNGFPAPDRIFIGGSCGRTVDILDWVKSYNRSVRVVANAVAIESAYEIIKSVEEKGFENVEIVNLSVSRSRAAGGKHLMQALNPIYIISADYHGGKS